MSKFDFVKDLQIAQENTFVMLLMNMAILQQLGATKSTIFKEVVCYLYEIDEDQVDVQKIISSLGVNNA
jgi:hypothetical protein